jgi:hypothetical protein
LLPQSAVLIIALVGSLGALDEELLSHVAPFFRTSECSGSWFHHGAVEELLKISRQTNAKQKRRLIRCPYLWELEIVWDEIRE